MSFVCWDYTAGHGRAGIESQTLQLRPAEPRPERPGELFGRTASSRQGRDGGEGRGPLACGFRSVRGGRERPKQEAGGPGLAGGGRQARALTREARLGGLGEPDLCTLPPEPEEFMQSPRRGSVTRPAQVASTAPDSLRDSVHSKDRGESEGRGLPRSSSRVGRQSHPLG